MTNGQMIELAVSVVRSRKVRDRLFADVGAAVLSKEGQIFTGVCVDTSSWGICAERSAVAAMITAGLYEIDKIVAVWKDEQDGKIYVLPPCGICREFIRSIDEGNLEAEIILGLTQTSKLRLLLPLSEWPSAL